LINVLYDRDHYKLALGQLHTAKKLVDNIAKDYVRLLKYGDSLFRCKQLKRAALGRMCTLMKKQHTSLAYLEQVRQHMARLPSIDPNTRTLIVCGYPNVGKSSFLNKISRANVDVQPYAFTTKSLFVGHTDYKDLRWQVIDTPGILDHPLEERNTIEMQSITALAHLRAAVLFLIDISEQCGYTIEQQVALFKSIKPLFTGKPLIIVINKVDVLRPENVRDDAKHLLEELEQMENATVVPMSNHTEEGIMKVKQTACDILLSQRVESRLQGSHISSVLNRVHVAVPKPRDNNKRPPQIPQSVLNKRVENTGKQPKTRQQLREEMKQRTATITVVPNDYDSQQMPDDWDPTKYSIDWRREYLLANDDWKFDPIPEIYNGKNIADFVDPDILKKLEELEKEELILDETRANQSLMDVDTMELDEDTSQLLQKIRKKKEMMVLQHRVRKRNKAVPLPRKAKAEKESTVSMFEKHLEEMGIDPKAAVERVRSRSRARSKGREARSESRRRKRQREVMESAERAQKRAKSSLPNAIVEKQVEKVRRKAQYNRNKEARKGEGDRSIPSLKPKHLYSGKRGIGKTDRR